MKNVLSIAAVTAVTCSTLVTANQGAQPRPPSNADQNANFVQEQGAKIALVNCLTTKKTNDSGITVAAAKTACKTEAGVNTAFTTWNQNDRQAAVVTEWFQRDPMIQGKLRELFPIGDVSSASDADIGNLIGSTDANDVTEFKQKSGIEKWGADVKACRTATAGTKSDAEKLACVTDTSNLDALCTKTQNTLPCCNGDQTSTCTATDALNIVEKAADDKMSQDTKACSKVADTTPADIATCMAGLRTAYEETTGKTVDAVGQREKLANEAKGAVGDAVGACMGNIDSSLTENAATSARMACRGGTAAKTAMAEALGKSASDITATDAAKYAREGAKTAGTDVFKAGTGSTAEQFARALTDMAAAAGKKSGGDCDTASTWDKECLTAVDTRKAVDAGAQDCMADAISACLDDTTTTDCKPSTAAVKTAVKDCTGYTDGDLTDEKLGRMQEKAKGSKVVDARKAAFDSCTGDATAKASCVATAALTACNTAKGVASDAADACDLAEVALVGNKGAAKDMAETVAACLDAGETNCDTVKQAAYEAATGKTYSAVGAAKLIKDGARGEVADLMSACFEVATDAATKRACSDPTSRPEIKEAFAKSMGKSAADITGTEFKRAVADGAKADSGLAIDACLDAIASAETGTTKKTSIKACHTSADVFAEVRAACGKPEAADMTDMDVKNFLQASAKDLQKDRLGACLETAADAGAKNICRGKGSGAAAIAKRTELKDSLGKPDMTDERAEKEMRGIARDTVSDDFITCMETNALDLTNVAASKTAFTTCKTAADTKRADLFGETADPIKAQKDVVKAAQKKVAANVEACMEAGGATVATCGDPATNAELKNKLKLMTGKVEITNTEARKIVKDSGNKAAGDFMKTCMEDSDSATFAGCMTNAKSVMGDATGKASSYVMPTKDLIGGLREAATAEVTDALAACVASGKTATSTECKAAKFEAFKATGLGDGKTDKVIKVEAEKAFKKGAQKSMMNAKQACLDIAADDTAKAACNTNELADAKKAKAEAEGKNLADITDSDVAKDLEKGKQEDTASAMEACTEKASGDTETRACRAAVATHVAAMEGKTAPDRRRLTAMEQNKIDKRMAKAGVQSFAKKMAACMDAAELETDSTAKATAKTACDTDKTNVFTAATGKAGSNDGAPSSTGDIKEGDIDITKEDAAVAALMDTNRATAKAKVDGETYTAAEELAMKNSAINKVKGSSIDEAKGTFAALKKKAGAKAVGEKAAACVAAAATPDAAKAATGCGKADLMEEDKIATGKSAADVTDVAVKKAKREAQKEILKDKMKACGNCINADETDVAKYLERDTKIVNDKKQASASLLGDKMKSATGTTTEKRTKMKTELKRLTGKTVDPTDEELDGTLDMAGMDTLDAIDDCEAADKAACRTEADATLKAMLDCKPKAVKVKKNQIAKLAAGRAGADAKEANKSEADIELAEKNKYESVGGAEPWDVAKAEVKKAREAYDANKEVVIKKKKSVDVIVEYAGDCGTDDDAAIKTAMDEVDATMEVARVGQPKKDATDNKCKATFVVKKKAGETAATDDELKGAIADKYTAVTTAGRRLNDGRRLPTVGVSADQSAEVESTAASSSTGTTPTQGSTPSPAATTDPVAPSPAATTDPVGSSPSSTVGVSTTSDSQTIGQTLVVTMAVLAAAFATFC